eukprot:1144809-Pelagomonas_calceolata.AAC.2
MASKKLEQASTALSLSGTEKKKVEPDGAEITNTICRAKLAAIAAAPEKYKQHIQGGVLISSLKPISLARKLAKAKTASHAIKARALPFFKKAGFQPATTSTAARTDIVCACCQICNSPGGYEPINSEPPNPRTLICKEKKSLRRPKALICIFVMSANERTTGNTCHVLSERTGMLH